MTLGWKREILHLKETFSIAHGKYDFRETLIVELAHKGYKGYGECVGVDYYGINLADFVSNLKQIQEAVEKSGIPHPFEFFSFLYTLNLHSFLLSALDCAYWDLYGKLEGKSFAELNNINGEIPESSLTVSVAPWEEQLRKIEKSSWNKFKVKCNGLNADEIYPFLEIGKKIALDANTSFSEDDCAYLQNNPLTAGFEYIEQPRPIGGYINLYLQPNAVWMADEDCQDCTYLETLSPHYAAINIKLMKCGGITPALELINEARKFNFEIMIGCMTESSVGISAGIAIAALCDFADLDGANLISNDFASGSFVKEGQIIVSHKPGLGIAIK